MEYIYASLLLHAAKKEISEENIKNVLSAAGITVDEVRLKAVAAALEEVNIDEILKTATAMPVAAVAAAPAGQQTQQAAEKKEEKKEEEKKGPSEEEIGGGLSSLFG
nr:ribosomal A protein SacL12 [Sulfolobus acidocaldarius]